MAENRPPTLEVLRAFGVPGADCHHLLGGQGHSFVAENLVLKRIDNIKEARWSAEVLNELTSTPAFRVARPARGRNGDWVYEQWTAFARFDGEHALEDRWLEVLVACRGFHSALAHTARPDFLDTRQDPWSFGDRVACDGLVMPVPPVVKHWVDDHLRLLAPLSLPSQVIHGDFGGNILFARDQPPAVIDFSPYWRPALFAEAIVIADAIAWNGAHPTPTEWFADRELGRQLLLRAYIYRVVTAGVAFSSDMARMRREIDAYERVVDVASARY